jgi:hypothetical protein
MVFSNFFNKPDFSFKNPLLTPEKIAAREGRVRRTAREKDRAGEEQGGRERKKDRARERE